MQQAAGAWFQIEGGANTPQTLRDHLKLAWPQRQCTECCTAATACAGAQVLVGHVQVDVWERTCPMLLTAPADAKGAVCWMLQVNRTYCGSPPSAWAQCWTSPTRTGWFPSSLSCRRAHQRTTHPTASRHPGRTQPAPAPCALPQLPRAQVCEVANC